ncbi:DNase I-like protein [Clavulina sp. PMI_390]|nr:DNase I-like protein [Clavulina sp. PMI_390]
MHLYLKDEPRALILVTTPEDERLGAPARGLVFKPSESRTSNQVIVEFLPKHEIDLTAVVRLTNRSVHGCLGLLSVGNDVFVAVITQVSFLGNIRPAAPVPENVSRVQGVQFFCINNSAYDDLSSLADSLASPSFVDGIDVNRDPYSSPAPVPSSSSGAMYEHPCGPLTKILGNGTFYYATQSRWDISSRLAVRMGNRAHDISAFDDRFIWNQYIAQPLLDFRDRLDADEAEELDRCQFVVLVIQGYVGVFDLPLPTHPSAGTPTIGTLAVVSRLGCKRAGTRFNTRGVDDDGNVANFVETETLFSTNEHSFSYAQIRGSIPLFWEQQGFQTFGQKIQITRPQAASQPAFDRHFLQLTEEYASVHAINLLSTKENEALLSESYAQHIRAANAASQRAAFSQLQSSDNASIISGISGSGSGMNSGVVPVIGITNFDFHAAVRQYGHDAIPRELRRQPGITNGVDDFGYCTVDTGMGDVVMKQKGVFRTNCLDCLDRTNFVQDILSKTALEQYLYNFQSSWTQSGTLWSNHRELWAENGDALSKIYAGTGALNTSVTRSGKRTLAGVLSDATKSVSRAYINNFQDKGKQAAIDIFLGNLTSQKPVTIFDPIHDSVREMLHQRMAEYSSTVLGNIFIGTWNLNGRPASESLLPWLFPRPNTPEPDMFVIGFQEIVQLTAQQIVQTDPENLRRWELILTETFARRPDKKADYIILRSEQLVGTALILLVRSELFPNIRSVEAATRKTGLRGMSGNKGAVAIRLQYHDTTFCFVTAHLAAGHSNVEERNSDYRTIVNGLHFQKGRTIGNHDAVIWLGDMNYRIDLENEMVRSLATTDQLDALLVADQLKLAIDSQAAFHGYDEGPILFRPTYRYNLGSDTYDTSEKMRIPAWTDRILYRGMDLDLGTYSRAELTGSDHRPVFALFRVTIRKIDSAKKALLSQELLRTLVATEPGQKLEEKLSNLRLDTTFPPPSSDEKAWWDSEDRPNGRFPSPPPTNGFRIPPSNPFDDAPSSSSSSDEELYTKAQQAPLPELRLPSVSSRKPPPPLPARISKPP